MEAAIERLAALAFIVLGLSHLAAPRAWVRVFERVAAQGAAAGVVIGAGIGWVAWGQSV